MKSLLKRLIGADRPKIIAVFAATRADAASCVEHARTGSGGLPVWIWCAEPGEPLPDCDRYADAAQARREIRTVWPALSIVSWPGTRTATALKLLPFTVPPFRVVVRNEAGGFFPARPGPVLDHAGRSTRDASRSALVRLGEWLAVIPRFFEAFIWHVKDRGHGLWLFTQSVVWHTGDRLLRGLNWLWNLLLWFWSLFLAGLALIAPLFWPLALKAYRNRSTGRALTLDVAPPDDTSFTEVSVSGRIWPRRRLVKALKASDATWLIFRHPACRADAEPLLQLALHTGAFAVARQAAYTGWRDRLISRHPFRTLQPGEAAYVLCPVSPLIVFRREALRSFGLPGAQTIGAGLHHLFLQAAAAGLESFVVGGEDTLHQEPAMPLEDIEIALRAPELAPRHPALQRGNVAFSPLTAPGFRDGKPRVLVVSPYLPFPLSHGGAVRIYNLCRELSARIDFILVCFREAKDRVCYEDLHRVFREVHVIDIDEKGPDPTVPTQVHEYRNSAMSELIRRLCRERKIDLVQLEYTQMAEYRNCTGSLPVVLVEHDITLSLHQQLKTPQYPLWLKFEEEALRAATAIWTMSGQDRALAIEHGASSATTAVVPNGVDLDRFQPAPKTSQTPTILFVGSFRHLPNLLAYEAMRNNILPLVQRRVPNARLHVIAGPDHIRAAELAKKQKLVTATPEITLEGFVEDVRPAYRECEVVVIPLPVSAGTNIKLMEAMACGRAVVSTPVGCTGLDLRDNEDLLIRDLGPAFADAIADLLENETARTRVAQTARTTAEAQFGWPAIARHALTTYPLNSLN